MKDIIVIELPEGHSGKEIDAFIVGVKNIARVMFSDCVVSIETAETIGEVANGILRVPVAGDRGADVERREGLDGSGSDGPEGPGVPQPLRGAESRSDGRTEPLRGTGDGDEDEMARGKHRSWPKAWRILQKVGAGKHYPR